MLSRTAGQLGGRPRLLQRVCELNRVGSYSGAKRGQGKIQPENRDGHRDSAGWRFKERKASPTLGERHEPQRAEGGGINEAVRTGSICKCIATFSSSF